MQEHSSGSMTDGVERTKGTLAHWSEVAKLFVKRVYEAIKRILVLCVATLIRWFRSLFFVLAWITWIALTIGFIWLTVLATRDALTAYDLPFPVPPALAVGGFLLGYGLMHLRYRSSFGVWFSSFLDSRQLTIEQLTIKHDQHTAREERMAAKEEPQAVTEERARPEEEQQV